MGVIGSHGGVIFLSDHFEGLKWGEPPNFFSKFLVKSFVDRYIGKVKKSGSLLYAPLAATNILKCRGHFEPPCLIG